MTKFKKILRGFCILVFGFVLILATFNQVMLRIEKNQIKPIGQMVDLGDYKVHVYAKGDASNAPTLVLLSGSATVAPVYDFMPIIGPLSENYRVAVVEKAGYGYSDHAAVSRDIDTMLDEIRSALIGAGENPPFVLVPHSMSGLEALYWAQKHPEEIAAIIGLDMSVPESYDTFDHNRVKKMMYLGRTSIWMGFHRIPGFYPLHDDKLTTDQARQQRLLMYKNAVNPLYIKEGQNVYNNAQIVKKSPSFHLPLLMLSSDGKEIGDFWVPAQKSFADANDAKLYFLEGGHYLHHENSERITEMVIDFLSSDYGKVEPSN